MATKAKIGWLNALSLLTVAVCVDIAGALIQIVIFIGQAGGYIITALGVALFAMWFYVSDIEILSPRMIASLGANGAGEIISAGAWTGFTFYVVLAILWNNAEDIAGAVAPKPLKKAARAAVTTTKTVVEHKAKQPRATIQPGPEGRVIPFPSHTRAEIPSEK